MAEIKLIKDIVEGLWKPTTELIDNMHTSQEEKLTLKASFLQIQAMTLQHVLEYESKVLASRAAIIQAEAQAKSWLTRTWRPITMLVFLLMVVSYWLGLTPDSVTEANVERVFTLIQLGLGGYIVGRSAEKMTDTVVNRNVRLPE